jgi:hypothetical protein
MGLSRSRAWKRVFLRPYRGYVPCSVPRFPRFTSCGLSSLALTGLRGRVEPRQERNILAHGVSRGIECDIR